MYRVDLYGRVRRACHVEGVSIREAARVFGLHRDTVRKMLMYSLPPGRRRSSPAARSRLGPYTSVIDRILEDDEARPTRQRHTAKRILERLRDEHGFTGGYTIVRDYVRERRLLMRVVFVPLAAPTRPRTGRLRLRFTRAVQLPADFPALKGLRQPPHSPHSPPSAPPGSSCAARSTTVAPSSGPTPSTPGARSLSHSSRHGAALAAALTVRRGSGGVDVSPAACLRRREMLFSAAPSPGPLVAEGSCPGMQARYTLDMVRNDASRRFMCIC
jgi:hypothetical protein